MKTEKKMPIGGADFTNWMEDTYTEYAAQTYCGERLRMLINHHGTYRVTHGDRVLYQGSQRTHAEAAWESA